MPITAVAGIEYEHMSSKARAMLLKFDPVLVVKKKAQDKLPEQTHTPQLNERADDDDFFGLVRSRSMMSVRR